VTQDYYAPRFDIRVAGVTLAADVTQRVLSVTYDGSLDTADMFHITIANPGNQFTDSPLFSPGQEVELYMGYGADLTPMMLGEVTTIEPVFPEDGPPTISVSGYDKSYRMRHNQSVPRQFRYITDSLIVAQIALENLLVPAVDPSPWFHTSLTQTGTDFGFIKQLAASNLFDAYVYWDRLYFQLPVQGEAYVLEWGQSLRSFSPRLSTATMGGLQVVRGYNEELATAIVGVATGELLNLNELINRLGPSALELVASLGRRWIHSQKVSSPVDALGLGKALLQDLLNGLYEGHGSCIGLPALRAGRFITVKGVGKQFSGSYRLRRVRHTINDNGYLTEFDITQQAESSLLGLIRKKTDVEITPPRDRAEKFYGVYIAQVLQAPAVAPEPDPAAALGARVNVSYPWLSDLNESGWARVVSPSAGAGRGVYFMPAVGDTVIVAFQDGDISLPVVLGSVWDGPARPPVDPPSPANTVQVIKTRSGHTITLDDTPGIARVSIAHVNGSQVSLTADGNVSVTAVNDLSLTAQGNISLQASGITLNAIEDFSLKGEGVSVSALANLDLTATGTASLTADAVAVSVDTAMTIGRQP
jgi:phage protein D/phage baseplate assembly protein gpV